MSRLLAFALGLVLLPAVALADVTGPARVIAGDVLEIRGQRIRLYGIDAPEPKQPCWLGELAYPCGMVAKGYLIAIIGGKQVRCETRESDRDGRLLAVCLAGGRDLGEALVRDGWALADRLDGAQYVDEEAEARRQGLGLWAGSFAPPWEWRRQRQ